MRTKACTKEMQRGRLRKAEQFHRAAELIEALAGDGDDIGDAFVTLCVHAGIAGADVLCCARLGEHAQGENHNDAVTLLAKVDRALAGHLRTLLGVKTDAGYSHVPASTTDRTRARRAAAAIMAAARAA